MNEGNTDQNTMANWLKGLIRNTIQGTVVEAILAPIPPSTKPTKIASSFSEREAQPPVEQYDYQAPYDRAKWIYRYIRSKDILYLASATVSTDMGQEVCDMFYSLFPTSTQSNPIRPETNWLSHDVMFLQRGYFMRMSGTTRQVKLGFRWDRVGSRLALTPDKTMAAAWHDVYGLDNLPDYLSSADVVRVHTVQQQVTGEWRVFSNIPRTLIESHMSQIRRADIDADLHD